MHRLRVGRFVLGPALSDLRTACASSIPRPDRPIGVIAGTRSYLPFTSRLIPGVHDGLVSLARTRLDGAEWIALDGNHTFLMNHPEVADVTAAFLRDGRFPTRDQA